MDASKCLGDLHGSPLRSATKKIHAEVAKVFRVISRSAAKFDFGDWLVSAARLPSLRHSDPRAQLAPIRPCAYACRRLMGQKLVSSSSSFKLLDYGKEL